MDTITTSSSPFLSLHSGRDRENTVLGFIQEKYSDRLPPLSIAAHQVKYGAWSHSNCSLTALIFHLKLLSSQGSSNSSACQGFLLERLTPSQQLWAKQTLNYDATGCYFAPGLIHSSPKHLLQSRVILAIFNLCFHRLAASIIPFWDLLHPRSQSKSCRATKSCWGPLALITLPTTCCYLLPWLLPIKSY